MSKIKKTNKKEAAPDSPKMLTVVKLASEQAEQDLFRLGTFVKDFEQSLVYQMSQEALEKTRAISEMLNANSSVARLMEEMSATHKAMIEPMQILAEPFQRLNEQLEQIKNISDISIPVSLVQSIADLPTLQMPGLLEGLYQEPTSFEIAIPPSPAVIIRKEISNLEAKLEVIVEQTVKSEFDKFIEKAKIPVGIKNANCHCSKCGRLLFKVADISHFMTGTIKCSCGETLQMPRDLRFEAPKD